MNGHPKQYILVDTKFNSRFHLDFQEHVFRTVWKPHLFCASFAGAQKVCFGDLNKEISLKSKMEPVVKYGVYKVILFRVSNYGTKCRFLKDNTEMDPSITPH